ncbi:MAG: ribonuclease domain-containing protein [Pirellulaceae bacterium]
MPHSFKRRLVVAALVVLLSGGLGLGRYFGLLEEAPARRSEDAQPVAEAVSGPESASALDEAASAERLLTWNDGVLADLEEAEVVWHVLAHEKLPPRFLTKREAERLGWVASKGNLWEVAEGRVIGGDRFFNREGRLPDASGRQYVEADLNYRGGRRGAERLVFSTDRLIFVTRDHYDTFTQVKTTQ